MAMTRSLVPKIAALLLWLAAAPSQAAPLPTSLPTLIRYINYYGDGYTGTIPTQWGLLTRVTYLVLDSNDLTSSLPTEMGRMSALTYATWSSNRLSQVPSELGRLSVLKQISAAGNTGQASTMPTQLGQLSQLTSLYMSDSSLSGSVPTEVGQWESLARAWEVGTNQLTADLPTQIGSLTQFYGDIDFTYGQWTSSLPTEFGRLTMLAYDLDLHHGSFTGELPTEFGKFSQLGYWGLNVYSNELCGDVPSEVTALSTSDYYLTTGNMFGCDCGDDDCLDADDYWDDFYTDDYDYENLGLALGLGLGLGIPVLVCFIICCAFRSANQTINNATSFSATSVELGPRFGSPFEGGNSTFSPILSSLAVPAVPPPMPSRASSSAADPDKASAGPAPRSASEPGVVFATAAVAKPEWGGGSGKLEAEPYQHAVRATPKIDINLGGSPSPAPPASYSTVVIEPSAPATHAAPTAPPAPSTSAYASVVVQPMFAPTAAPALQPEVAEVAVAAEVVAEVPAGPAPTSFEALLATMGECNGTLRRKRALEAWIAVGGRATLDQLRSMLDGSSALGNVFRFKTDKSSLVETIAPALAPGTDRAELDALLDTLGLLGFQKTDILRAFDSRA